MRGTWQDWDLLSSSLWIGSWIPVAAICAIEIATLVRLRKKLGPVAFLASAFAIIALLTALVVGFLALWENTYAEIKSSGETRNDKAIIGLAILGQYLLPVSMAGIVIALAASTLKVFEVARTKANWNRKAQ